MRSRLPLLFAVLFLFTAFAEVAAAQGILNRARQAAQRGAERAVEREAQRRADRAVMAAIGATEQAIVCLATDRECIEGARAAGEELVIVDENNEPVAHENAPGARDAAAGGTPAAAPGEGVWANYDFVPGDRVLFYEDYTADRVGNFPQRLTFVGGNIEIVEWEGGRALRATSRGGFDVRLPEELPERFTLEFDAYLSSFVNDFDVYPVGADGRPAGEQAIQVDPYGGLGVKAFRHDGLSAVDNARAKLEHRMTAVRVMADGPYVKVYADEQRVANVPNANLGRSRTLRFDLKDIRQEPVYIGPIRVAASDRSLYDRLVADGRVATQGILFDTGSARIRPESTPTLEEIAGALRQNGDLRLRIEGHTDDVGAAEANLRLSEARARAVVAHLTQREGIAAGRLEAAGLGQTAPAADNASAEGRQQNRRVELVVLD